MTPRPVRGTRAIVLAAGASRRMGLPKPLLCVQGKPLALHLAETLQHAGVETITIVTSAPLQEKFVASPFEVVVNPDPEVGMLSSIQVGIAHTVDKSVEAVLVCPCDFPLLTEEPVYAILHYWVEMSAREPATILAPVFLGKRGHPTLFGAAFLSEIQAMDARQVGLNALLQRHRERVVEVPVSEACILQDADTPEEWERLLGEPPTVWRE